MSFQDTSAPQAFTAGAALCPHTTVRGADFGAPRFDRC
jgi:hypothetical protein